MERRSGARWAVPAVLLFFSAIPIGVSLVRLVQIPAGTLPAEALYFAVVPVWHFAHALAGATFGILGPLQFGRVLAGRYGRLHRVLGRVFVAAGALLSVSSLRLLWQFPGSSTWVLDGAWLVTGIAVGAMLWIAVRAIRRGDQRAHRAWMIRAYAIGMGAATVSLLFFPIFILTGEAPTGYAADLIFVLSWVINIVIGEWVIRRATTSGRARRANQMPA